MSEIALNIVEFFKQFSYFGVLLALCFEFIPAEIVLPLAGYWVSQGDFNIHLLALAGTVGGTIGPATLYALGRYGGRPIVEKYGKYFLVTDKQIRASDQFFEKYGHGVAFFARFLPVVRTAISIPCGMTKMKFSKFCLYTFLAMYPITYFYLYLGFKLGENWEQAGAIFDKYAFPIAGVVVAAVIAFVIYKRMAADKNRAASKIE
ncbi:DedA family protein [Bacillus sp. AGMB 02131]|uniref:DedA family protein n=1 Tax=Peribacillus faecalis TaxID=2772559 RepID=A0A927CWV1_9BACI|nr:DedA family protein [Peribacillus faecalis]MBD3109051.1 DedA family protein [Peribacillus faecalis]